MSFRVGEIETLQEGKKKDCTHANGRTEKSKEYNTLQQDRTNEFRVVAIFICNTCNYMARRYDTAWMREEEDND